MNNFNFNSICRNQISVETQTKLCTVICYMTILNEAQQKSVEEKKIAKIMYKFTTFTCFAHTELKHVAGCLISSFLLRKPVNCICFVCWLG